MPTLPFRLAGYCPDSRVKPCAGIAHIAVLRDYFLGIPGNWTTPMVSLVAPARGIGRRQRGNADNGALRIMVPSILTRTDYRELPSPQTNSARGARRV